MPRLSNTHAAVRRVGLALVLTLAGMTSLGAICGNAMRPPGADDTASAVSVTSPTTAEVLVDGRPTDSTSSPFLLSVRSGDHSLEVRADGFQTYTHQFHVDNEQRTLVLPDVTLVPVAVN